MLLFLFFSLCHLLLFLSFFFFFFFNDTATTEIYTLSLHDALPISAVVDQPEDDLAARRVADDVSGQLRDRGRHEDAVGGGDRKSTRLNSSHGYISYAVFCLKKKKKKKKKVSAQRIEK